MLTIERSAPSVLEMPFLDPVKDVHDLHKAIKSLVVDSEVIIRKICKRSNAQRQVLREKYKQEFGTDLIDDIKSKLTFNFKKTIVSLLQEPTDFYAIEVHEAISKKSSDTFVEVLGPFKPSDVRIIRDHYQKMYSSKLSDDISKAFSEPFRHFALHLISDERSDSMEVNVEEAKKTLETIMSCLHSKTGKEDETIISILTKSNMQQLSKISDEHGNNLLSPLSESIIKNYTGAFKETFVAMVEIAEGASEFYAKRLKKSMKGLGTDDAQLIRIIVSRSEIDLGVIDFAFQFQNSKTLKAWIEDDTSGDYKKALLSLITISFDFNL